MVNWAGGYELALKEPGIVLFSMTRTKARDELFHWIGPIRTAEQGLWALRSSGLRIAHLEAAKRIPWIGVYKDDVRDQYLTSQGFSNLDRSTSHSTNIKKLLMGRIPAIASSRHLMESSLREEGVSLEEVELIFPFLEAQVYIAMSLKTPQTAADSWNRVLRELKADGTFAFLHQKYYPGVSLPGPAIKPLY